MCIRDSIYPAMIACAAYLIIKGIMFISALASIIDFVTGILLVFAYFFAIPSWILLASAILIIQKGLFSLAVSY